MRSGTRQIREGIELPNQERIRTVGEKENYKDILEVDRIKQAKKKTKKKNKNKTKVDLRRTRKLLKIKFYGRNLFKGINLGCPAS